MTTSVVVGPTRVIDTVKKQITVFIEGLNRLRNRHVETEDFIIYHALVENMRRESILLNSKDPLIMKHPERAWLVIMVKKEYYILDRSLCNLMPLDSDDKYIVNLRFTTKVFELSDDNNRYRIEYENLVDEYDTLKTSHENLITTYNTLRTDHIKLEEESVQLRDELKRKRVEYDELVALQPDPNVVAIVAAPVEDMTTKKCNVCGNLAPVKSFTETCKKTRKSGEVKVYTSTRQTCNKCRWLDRKQKKAKTV